MSFFSQDEMFVYQADGVSRDLHEANICILKHKRKTPESIRDKYRSSIRFLPTTKEYLWQWVLK